MISDKCQRVAGSDLARGTYGLPWSAFAIRGLFSPELNFINLQLRKVSHLPGRR